MAAENGLDLDTNTTAASTSGNNDLKTEVKENHGTKTVPFYKLFSFADSVDKLLMIVGSIGVVGNGLCMPLMTVLFGDLIDSFGQNQNKEVLSVVSKVSLKFVYLALGCGVAAFLQVACWMITGERQASRIRSLYLKTILRQDVAFFDKETNTGEVVGRMSGDTVLIQDAMGEKVGKFMQLLSTFLGGFVIAFIKGWLLTLVMLTSIPLLAISGSLMAVALAKMASSGQEAYAKAANIVEQTIGSIRTVASFTGEKKAVAEYDKSLVNAYKSGVREGWASGLGMGCVFLIAVIHQGKVVEKGTHSELLEDSEGAYSQLIRLQDESRDQGHDEKEKSDITMDSLERHSSSKNMSYMRSISRGSSGRGNSSRHRSLSNNFGLPSTLNVSESQHLENSDAKSEKPPKVPLRRLAYLNKPEVPVLMAGALSALINGAIMPTFGILIAGVIKTFFESPHKLRKDSNFWAIIFVVLGVVSLIAYPARTYLFGVAGNKLIKRIRLLCFEKVINMEIGWFDESEHSSGFIGARLSADAASVRALVGDALAQMVQDLSSAVVGLVIAFQASWQLALIVLVMLPLIGLNGFVQIKFMKGFSADAKAMYEEASQVANDAVGSIRTVASFCAEEKIMEMYKKKCEGPMKNGIKQGLISGIGFGLSFSLLFLVYGASFYFGARLVQDGKTTFSEVFRVFFALTMAAMAISQSSAFAPDSTKAKSAAASIFAILDRKSTIDPSDESGVKLDSVKGEIELRHVSFKYPTRPNVQILRDFSLKIHSGKTVALVGESGSGKSTVISLLQRFYDPESGNVTLDGVEIQKFQLKWLRQQMGLVSQEPILFNDTIRANIAYGKEGNATESEVIAAAELANAHKFISGLQQGYDTVVGERGVQLSGGQKQRVAIARAIMKSPKILLLDEATSALDAESERIVQDALDRATMNRTTVVVAHRLSTIKAADVIAVVKNGAIVEKGKHDTLINIKDGFYASLLSLNTTTSAPSS